MGDEKGTRTLKLAVVAHGDASAAAEALSAFAREEDVRAVGEKAWVVYTAAETAAIRDRMAAALDADALVLVVEFERWSAYGEAIDREWLLRRGH
jgi:hypothetical protein